jgi:PAS domain S-box-containing protein
MPNRILQPIYIRIATAFGIAATTAFAGVQDIASAGNEPESMILGVIAILGVVAGVTLGIVYRKMSAARDAAIKRADSSDAELRAVLTMTDEAIILLDSSAFIRSVNPAAEEIFGRPAEDLIGDELGSLIAHPMNLAELSKHGPSLFTSTTTQEGTRERVEVVISEVHLSRGNTYLAIIRSGTNSAGVPDLTAPVAKFSHDLNNVLTTITGNLSLILRTSSPDPVTMERITGAKRAALKAQELNRKLLLLSKGEEDEPLPSTIVQMPAPVPTLPLATIPDVNNPNRRILVLDDETEICSLISTVLGPLGFELTETYDSNQAIVACEEAVNAGKPFALVISDLCLPGGISGEETVRRMKAMIPGLKAIVSSGHDTDPVMINCHLHGFCAAIPKPYDISKLGQIVTKALEADPKLKSA